jgi:hypothetical protein
MEVIQQTALLHRFQDMPIKIPPKISLLFFIPNSNLTTHPRNMRLKHILPTTNQNSIAKFIKSLELTMSTKTNPSARISVEYINCQNSRFLRIRQCICKFVIFILIIRIRLERRVETFKNSTVMEIYQITY